MRALLAAVLLLLMTVLDAGAQEGATPPPSPEQIQDLNRILADPAVQDWLREAAGRETPPKLAPPDPAAGGTLAGMFRGLQDHLRGLAAELPHLPAEFELAGERLSADIAQVGVVGTLLLIVGFLGLGLGTEWIFWHFTRPFRKRVIAAPVASVPQRVRILGARFLFSICWVAAFTIGSLGACFLFPWPPVLRSLLLGVLAIVVGARLAWIVARLLLAPGAEKFRIVPTTTEGAWFWTYRLTIFTGYLTFSWVMIDLMATLGFTATSIRLLSYPFGFFGLFILAEAILNQPGRVQGRAPPGLGLRIAIIAWIVLAWLTRVVGIEALFNIMMVALVLPLAIRISYRAVVHLMRPGDLEGDAPAVDLASVDQPPSPWTIAVERAIRLMLFAVGAWFVIRGFGVDMNMMTASDNLGARFLRSLLRAVAILLVADLIWQVAKTMIDRSLAHAAVEGSADPAEVIRRRQRIRTLLPIARNVLLVVLATMGVLMALSSLGIEIAPLIAGAGVVGVAIGFGAQTLVKDVISGMFYLLDDAFRIGEYIVSGSYKGTVESFSLRSVKLRHHRGPLYTVPFGELGAIQNMSRDWVIDKLAIGVTYDTDLDKAKKIIKEIGKELLADPELGPGFIEPLKMQGVDSFGDFAIQIRLKMMTYPGKQFTIRRRAYAMIKRAFAENGIEIAFPTVRVAGGDRTDSIEAAAGRIAQEALAARTAET